MAKNKLKMTGFARFFIVMLILAPVAYIGASYANGEDGIENFKNLFKGKISMGENANQESSDESATTKTIEIPATSSQTSTIDQAEIEAKDKRISELEESNKELKAELYQKTKDLEKLEAALEEMKNKE